MKLSCMTGEYGLQWSVSTVRLPRTPMVCFDCPTRVQSVHTQPHLTLPLACERSLTNERRPQESLTEVASGTHLIGYVQGKGLA